jgi:hypothetical protein
MWLNLELKCVDVDGVEPVMVKEASCTEARGGTCEKVAGKRLRRPVWGLFSAPFPPHETHRFNPFQALVPSVHYLMCGLSHISVLLDTIF